MARRIAAPIPLAATGELWAWVLLPPEGTSLTLCERWLGGMLFFWAITVCLLLIVVWKTHKGDAE